ncbi:MAG: NADPH-dependent glutamate synthase [Treponema sp.]|nr:NADPH-dependent glutamate synthase [Treponema sp.]
MDQLVLSFAQRAARGESIPVQERLKVPAQPMPVQDPESRIHTMSEVALGYSEQEARLESLRCLGCPTAPCVAHCPVAVDIPRFIAQIQRARYREALQIITQTNALPAICGRVCPQEKQCQCACTVGIALKDPAHAVGIGRLERFVADWEREHPEAVPEQRAPCEKSEKTSGKKVAVIGSGPAGLTVAADCARAGHAVTVFEALPYPGGVLQYGIPEFRLPKQIVDAELERLRTYGVVIKTDTLIGRTFTVAELQRTFDALFIGTGAGLPQFLNIAGEDLVGVCSANEYLTRVNLMKAGRGGDTPLFYSKVVTVIGGGNVAMDAARVARRLRADVHIIYRRTRAEMPARAEEIAHAEEEGITIHFLRTPLQIIGTDHGRVSGLQLQRLRLGAADSSGRRSPVPESGQTDFFACDTVIVALGNHPNPLLARTVSALNTDSRGAIIVDQDQVTSIPFVFAGGDSVHGAATVILAMGEGRKAAAAITQRFAASP